MNAKVIATGIFILWLVSMFMVSSCQKIERDIPQGSQDNEKYYRLYVVGRDNANGVICYGNSNNNAAISCVKVK